MHESAKRPYAIIAHLPLARRGKRATSAHSIAAVAVLGAHMLGLVLFWTLREANVADRRDEGESVLLLLPLAQERQIAMPASAARASNERRRRKPELPADASLPAPQVAPLETSAPVGIDWANEARLAATRQTERDAKSAQRARSFVPRRGHSLAVPVSPPQEFGWYYASTHRVEVIPGGGIIFNLNDRCAVVMMLIPIPACRIGKIEARGDLFLHMHEPVPLAGDTADLP